MVDAIDRIHQNTPVNRAGFGGYAMWDNSKATPQTALRVALETLYPDQNMLYRVVLDAESHLATKERGHKLSMGCDVLNWLKGNIDAPGLEAAVDAVSRPLMARFGVTSLDGMKRLVMEKAPGELAAMVRQQ